MYSYQTGNYLTTCDAVAPQVAVRIGGASLPINPRDREWLTGPKTSISADFVNTEVIFRDIVDPMTGLCVTSVASGGAGPFILGAAFLQNVLSIFDVGNAEMRFLSRPFY